MRLCRAAIIGIMGLLGCAAAGWAWLHAAKQSPVAVSAAAPDGPAALFAQVKTATASLRPLTTSLEVVGSVSYDQDRYAIVGPLVSGRIVSLQAQVGSVVAQHALLGEVESPEVGRARSAYIAAVARAAAAGANWRREQALARQQISSARELEVAQTLAVQEEAARDAALQTLRAMSLSAEAEGFGGRVPLRAPLAGTVVARQVALGQSVEHGTDAFIIADLSHLWVMLDIYEKDLERIETGQQVVLRTESLPGVVMAARIGSIEARVDTKSRTASVRVEFDNAARQLRPGQFVTARLSGQRRGAPSVVVPRLAIQEVDHQPVVFVRRAEGFVPRPVHCGAHDAVDIEILDGLQDGDEVAAEGSFLLKSQLGH